MVVGLGGFWDVLGCLGVLVCSCMFSAIDERTGGFPIWRISRCSKQKTCFDQEKTLETTAITTWVVFYMFGVKYDFFA